jgi:hypothetical protein
MLHSVLIQAHCLGDVPFKTLDSGIISTEVLSSGRFSKNSESELFWIPVSNCIAGWITSTASACFAAMRSKNRTRSSFDQLVEEGDVLQFLSIQNHHLFL